MRCFHAKTALDNVATGLEVAGVARRRRFETRARTGSLAVGLGGFCRRYTHMLSGGQREPALGSRASLDPAIRSSPDGRAVGRSTTRPGRSWGNLLVDLWNATQSGAAVRHTPTWRRRSRGGSRGDHVGRATRGSSADWRVELHGAAINFRGRSKRNLRIAPMIWSVISRGDGVFKDTRNRERVRLAQSCLEFEVCAEFGMKKQGDIMAFTWFHFWVRRFGAAATFGSHAALRRAYSHGRHFFKDGERLAVNKAGKTTRDQSECVGDNSRPRSPGATCRRHQELRALMSTRGPSDGFGA